MKEDYFSNLSVDLIISPKLKMNRNGNKFKYLYTTRTTLSFVLDLDSIAFFFNIFYYQLAKGDGNKTTILPYHLRYLQLFFFFLADPFTSNFT